MSKTNLVKYILWASLVSPTVSDDPPRPADGSPLYQEMGGYSAPRGDFSTEFNNYAEHDICSITFDEDGHGYLPSDAEEDEEESGYDQEDNELMNGECSCWMMSRIVIPF